VSDKDAAEAAALYISERNIFISKPG
jgi:hypothetical protein